MILRPVSPVSPLGPPTTNLPVGLMWKMMSSFQSFRGMTGLMTCSMICRLAFSLTASVFLSRTRFIVLGGNDDGVNAGRGVR